VQYQGDRSQKALNQPQNTPQFRRIEQPLVNKVAVTLGDGIGLGTLVVSPEQAQVSEGESAWGIAEITV